MRPTAADELSGSCLSGDTTEEQQGEEGSVSCWGLRSEGETAPPGGQSSRSAQVERFLRFRRCFQLPVRLFFPSDAFC